MKKFLLIIIIVAYCFISFFVLFENSTDMSIDYTQLRTKNDYKRSVDEIPENISEKMVLKIKNKYDNLKLDIEGEYYRQPINEQTLKIISKTGNNNPSFVWNRFNTKYENSGKVDVMIIFTSNNTCVIYFPLKNIINTYDVIYNDRTLQLKDEFFKIASFDCNFLYTHNVTQYKQDKIENVVDNNTPTNEDATGDNQNHNSSDKNTADTFENKDTSFFSEYITSEIVGAAFGLFISSFTFLIIFTRTSRLIKHRYTKNLKHTLFPTQDHSWFSNNSPNDIYVSIKVHQKDGFKEYKLQNYFANKLSSSPSVYAILGNAGEGKTFSLYKIALDILEGVYGISNTSISTNKKFTKSKLKLSQNKSPNNKLVPIIINFSDIYGSKTEEDIIECIYQKICKVADIKRFWFGNKKSEKTTKVLKRFLCTGKFVIMFDGYDEIINTNDRLAFSKVLIDFIRTYNSCYYIITSRTQVYESERFENIATENTVYLSPLSKEQIREFLSKWSFPKDKSDTQLFHRIINTVQLENVVTNPLLLTMVTHTYCKSDFVFSQSKTNLYKQCCNCLLENWEKQKFRLKRFKRFTILPNVELKIELLSQLAYEIYLGNGHNISESKVLKLWSSNEAEKIYYHGKTQEVLDNIITQSGLLEKTDTNLLRFRHRSFYEYFVALYLVKNVCSPTTSFEYVKSNENINFFYLSLLKDEKIVLGFLSSHLCDTKTVLDVLVERKISDREKLVNIIEGVLSKIDYEETSNLQAIGYIAQQYVEVRDLVLHDLVGKLEYCNSKETKVNIIVSLMTFSSKKQIKRVLKSHVNNINIKDLILYSGENIKDYSSFIIDIIDSNEEKRIFVENLAKEYQFDAIYNIYIQENSKLNKDIAIIGLLYMASDTELISFLKAKNFNNTVSYEMKKEITILQNKYTWIEKLKFSETDNLYTLIYLSKELIKNGFKVNISMIDNRLKFLISYILSDESGKIHCKLIDIPNFEIISQIEFSYHWNRRKQNKSNDTYIYNGVINAPLLNRVITSIIFLLVILQMILYLFHKIRIYDLVYTGWEVKFSSSNDFAMFPFNSMYLLFLGSIFVSCYIIHKFLRKIDYSNFSITLSICVSLILFTTYTFIVQNIFFRLSMLIVISCICICENIKHRYNYPSFKDPQYSLIVDYLK